MTQAPPIVTCQVCGTSTGKTVAAREMMYGTREPFHYFECDGCGCLQLTDVPADLSPYYPQDYYSFAEVGQIPARSGLRAWCNARRNAGSIFGHDVVSWLLSRLRPEPDFSPIARLLRPTRVRSLDAKILDVGCGAGNLLSEMADAGFQRLVGVDPFAAPRTDAGGRLQIHACSLEKLGDTNFDFVMSHHSLEHMADQIGTLRQIRRVLKSNGECVIRIPVASSGPWGRYREHWVELDPPRHLVVHTQRSFETAAKDAGLEIYHVKYDDTAFAYWGSELYNAGIALIDPDTRKCRPPLSKFTHEQINDFEAISQVANANQTGGRAAFYLRKL